MDSRDKLAWDVHAEQLSERPPLVASGGKIITYPYSEADKMEGDNLGADWALEIIKSSNINIVVDVGCGAGLYSGLFEDLDYTGVDQNEDMICVAKNNHPEKKYIVVNGRELTSIFALESIDMVFTRAVIQHQHQIMDKTALVNQIHSVLKPGGFLLCMESELFSDGDTSLEVSQRFADLFGFSFIDHQDPFGRLFTKKITT